VLRTPMDIVAQFPVRRSKVQKESFRSEVRTYGEKLGYSVSEEAGPFGACNLVLGDPKTAKFLVTAHYDTCARMLLPNLGMPCNFLLSLLYRLFRLILVCLAAIVFGVAAGLLLGESLVKPTIAFVFLLLLLLRYFGPANMTNVNDNTSGVITLLEIARTMPENQRNKVCFVLFDLEEFGLIGSAAYRKQHKEDTDNQLILNLDCVGDGDNLLMLPTKALKKDRKKLASLYRACGYFGKKSLLLHEKGATVYPSDHRNFPYAAAICALRKKKKILYLSYIHTQKDTVLDETNVNILRAALTTFICRDEVN